MVTVTIQVVCSNPGSNETTDISVSATGFATAYLSITSWSYQAVGCGQTVTQQVIFAPPCGNPSDTYTATMTSTFDNPDVIQPDPLIDSFAVYTPNLTVTLALDSAQYNPGDTVNLQGQVSPAGSNV